MTISGESSKEVNNEATMVGYQVAVSLWTNESSQNWARFNVMLVANSVALATLSTTLSNDNINALFITMISFVGIFLCILWILMTLRGFDYEKYFVLSSREMEHQLGLEHIRTVARGASAAEGKNVNFQFDDKVVSFRFNRLSTLLKTKWMALSIIIMIMLLYLSFVIYVNSHILLSILQILVDTNR